MGNAITNKSSSNGLLFSFFEIFPIFSIFLIVTIVTINTIETIIIIPYSKTPISFIHSSAISGQRAVLPG